MKTEQMDTTKAGIKELLDKAAENTGKAYHSGETMRLAVFRFVADSVGLDGEARQQAFKQFQATPGWFGANASACRQAYESKEGKEKFLADYVA